MFLASCCVIDEPPCTTLSARALTVSARKRADDVDAEMIEETPILGRQHGLDQIFRQFVERDRFIVLDAAPADLLRRSGRET